MTHFECISACPHCIYSCSLDQNHWSEHRCADGHTWS
jgi:hypothetical protein